MPKTRAVLCKPPSAIDAAWKRTFRRRLLTWYSQHARDLPWRRSRDPYQVWVSEIMLQQTQVVTVVDYFQRFIAAFPTVAALAQAPVEQVLRLWEGLGYYRRARQMHRAAEEIVRDHGGAFPEDIATVRRLPGIGRYTAGAILSIAFDQSQPILEANTVRLFSRLLAYQGDPLKAEGQRLLWSLAEDLVAGRDAGALNQALMELGSTLCTPRNPQCDRCPVASLCRTRELGLQEQIPLLRARPKPEDVQEAAVVVFRRGKILLQRRGNEGRWAGLWDFPRFVLASHDGAALVRELRDHVERLTGVVATPGERLTTIRHGVTRFRITLHCHRAEYVSTSTQHRSLTELRWIKPVDLAEYPLSVTGRKLGHLVIHGLKSPGNRKQALLPNSQVRRR
jgi:A/G-specific adenine glycosylase